MARLHRNLRNGNILSAANSAWLKKKQLSDSIVKMYKKAYLLPNEFDGVSTAKPFACYKSNIKAKLLQSINLQNWVGYYYPTWYFVISTTECNISFVSFDGQQYLQIFNLASLTQWASPQPHEANTDIYRPSCKLPSGVEGRETFQRPHQPLYFPHR